MDVGVHVVDDCSSVFEPCCPSLFVIHAPWWAKVRGDGIMRGPGLSYKMALESLSALSLFCINLSTCVSLLGCS